MDEQTLQQPEELHEQQPAAITEPAVEAVEERINTQQADLAEAITTEGGAEVLPAEQEAPIGD